MKAFTIFVAQLFCSTAKGSLLNFIFTLYPESFILDKKSVCNNLSYIPSLISN